MKKITMGMKLVAVALVAVMIVAAFVYLADPNNKTGKDPFDSSTTIYIQGADGKMYTATADLSSFTAGEAATMAIGGQARFYPLAAVTQGSNVGQTINGLARDTQYSVGFKINGEATLTGITSIRTDLSVFEVTGKNKESIDGVDRNFLYSSSDSAVKIGVPIPLVVKEGLQSFVAESGASNMHFTTVDSIQYPPGFPSQTMNLPITGRNIQGSVWSLFIQIGGVDALGNVKTSSITCTLTITASFLDGTMGMSITAVTAHTN